MINQRRTTSQDSRQTAQIVACRTWFTRAPRFSDTGSGAALDATLICSNGMAISRSSLWPFPEFCVIFALVFSIHSTILDDVIYFVAVLASIAINISSFWFSIWNYEIVQY
jgi:hypothetical protein